MNKIIARFAAACVLALAGTVAYADDFSDTIALFRNSNEASSFFGKSYGYAVFPTVGEGGFVIAGAYGKGQVYRQGTYVGDSSIIEVSAGAQAGAKAYSEIVFFQNKAAFDKFTSGEYQFSADASAVAVTAAAELRAGTAGVGANASTTKRNAGTAARYRKGVAVFVIVKGGAMLQAAVGGQKFSYTPKN